ncbi:MAG: HAD-IA family hydrolase [Woeseiaceae bacterium]|nr:HAD-IA family hydrolase [Woeseiaceae bacterium]
MADEEIKVILFDLGGVLLRLNDPIETFGLDITLSEWRERWLRSPSVRIFESGQIDTQEFAKRIVNEAQLPYDWQEFIERFDRWPDRLFDDTVRVLKAIPATYSKALLSNINPLHWEREQIAGAIAPHVDRVFLSYETGLVKPDREAFDLVLKVCDCKPAEILFFDDTESSVAAANKYGLQSVHAVGIDTVKTELRSRGVID